MQPSPTHTTALFVGTFDPFTIGHADIVERTLQLVDKLVIGVGVNPDKHTMFSSGERIGAIRSLYADEPRVSVVTYSDLAVDLAKRVGAKFIVRGVRSVKDFEYERDQAEYNKRLGNVETLLLYADPTLTAVSSSAYRQLIYFQKDASWMLPGKGKNQEGREKREESRGKREEGRGKREK
ncbi:pantetheine-phosphate adenylyltransferase [Hallella bergensis]|uniref:pantetheine-phosphate adenylyltransferase n=1 Tax=Hallella bergensis TaxID=242750 RepID=UPI0039908D40